MTRIMFVCHGNICRSPMAEFVLRDLARRRGLGEKITAASSATSREEIGNGVHPGTRRKLGELGISCGGKRAVQLAADDYGRYDLILCMDANNVRGALRILGADPVGKVKRLLDLTGRPGDIADPWYTGNFEETYQDVCRGCEALLNTLSAED